MTVAAEAAVIDADDVAVAACHEAIIAVNEARRLIDDYLLKGIAQRRARYHNAAVLIEDLDESICDVDLDDDGVPALKDGKDVERRACSAPGVLESVHAIYGSDKRRMYPLRAACDLP